MKGRTTDPRMWRVAAWDCRHCAFRVEGGKPPEGRCPKCYAIRWEPVRVRIPIEPFVKTELREG